MTLTLGHVVVNGTPVPGALFDFGIWIYNYSRNKRDEAYIYIPKLENHNEAQWWNEV